MKRPALLLIASGILFAIPPCYAESISISIEPADLSPRATRALKRAASRGLPENEVLDTVAVRFETSSNLMGLVRFVDFEQTTSYSRHRRVRCFKRRIRWACDQATEVLVFGVGDSSKTIAVDASITSETAIALARFIDSVYNTTSRTRNNVTIPEELGELTIIGESRNGDLEVKTDLGNDFGWIITVNRETSSLKDSAFILVAVTWWIA